MISVPLCIIISITLPILLLYSTGTTQEIVYKINLLFSRRFTHIEHMFLTYPVSLTGGLFDTGLLEELYEYSVIDNGYIRFLYQYGVFGLTIFGLMTIIAFNKIIKNKEYIWAIIFIIIAIEGLLENIYADIGLNLFVMFWAEICRTDRKEIIQ